MAFRINLFAPLIFDFLSWTFSLSSWNIMQYINTKQYIIVKCKEKQLFYTKKPLEKYGV